MKKVLEETVTPQRSYTTTANIRVGESSGVKGSFWPEVLVGNRGGPSFRLVLHSLTTGQVIRSRRSVPASNLRKFST